MTLPVILIPPRREKNLGTKCRMSSVILIPPTAGEESSEAYSLFQNNLFLPSISEQLGLIKRMLELLPPQKPIFL